MKPYFRFKGRYKDGRKKIAIEYVEKGKIRSCILPKPEILLDRLKSIVFTQKK